MALVYERSITQIFYVPKSFILLARTGVWKIRSEASIKNDYSDYPKSLISRINDVYAFLRKYRNLFCCNHTCYCVSMVSVTSTSRYITSASCHHPRYQSRSSMYIRGLIPQNSAELAEAVPNLPGTVRKSHIALSTTRNLNNNKSKTTSSLLLNRLQKKRLLNYILASWEYLGDSIYKILVIVILSLILKKV